MKKTALTFILLSSSLFGFGQSYEHKWNVGLHGGAMQYMGDLGSSFYRFDRAFYGHLGVSVSRYLNRHWDASVMVTRGVVGFMGPWQPDPSVSTSFLSDQTNINLLARYNFMHPESWVRPYLCGGFGVIKHTLVGDSYFPRNNMFDYAIPQLGAGLKFQFGEYLGMQVQELFMYSSTDEIDRRTGGINDMYLLHTVGITCNIGKLGKLGGAEKTGVGADIDKCPKIKQHKNRATKSEGKRLRNEKKSKRKLNKEHGFIYRIFHRNKKA